MFPFLLDRALFAARVFAVALRLCPSADPVILEKYLPGLVEVSLDSPEPERAAALLLGAAGHETCWRTEYQYRGPAVTPYQLERRGREARQEVLDDPFLAADLGLAAARTCGGSFITYVSGQPCHTRSKRIRAKAAEVAGWAWRATRLLAGDASAWRPASAPPRSVASRSASVGARATTRARHRRR